MNPQVLEERYQMLCREPSDIYEHLPTFVDAVDSLAATKVIELGVRYGVSTVAWMYALQKRRGSTQGQLWAVDTSFPVAAPGSDVNLLDPQGPLGVVPYWIFLLGDDCSQAVLDALPDQVDIVFIDTMHTFEWTTRELELYYPRVRPGGRIFLHDTAIETTGNATTPQPPFPVRSAIEKFCQEKNLEWTNNPSCYGLGTICC